MTDRCTKLRRDIATTADRMARRMGGRFILDEVKMSALGCPTDAPHLERLGACDPRLLERLGVRREVCEAAARHVAEKEVGE